MDPMTIGLLAGGGMSLFKNEQDQKNYMTQMKLAAATQKYSPWTGLKAQIPNAPNPVGTTLSYMGAGGAMGQGVQNAGAGSPATSGGAMNANAMNAAGNNVTNQNPWSVNGPQANALGTYGYQSNPNMR